MGLPVQVHKKIAPALRCVERYIRRTCTGPKELYTPRALGGFRQNNTYRGGEISNHLFGIAIDIDPDRNPCCGCVSPWPNHPACRSPSDTVFERTALPRCWIDGFERFGFYWLGRDPGLRDTMHFEFLGDPEQLAP
jgi:D-alanyl-D-alanine carboxypeptidase